MTAKPIVVALAILLSASPAAAAPGNDAVEDARSLGDLATAAWNPPGFGHWRVRARFLGTETAATSESGYTRIFVAEPLQEG